MTAVVLRPASTVVLLRPTQTRFDVFLVRRHDAIAFMGGAHVFPGGRVDVHDRLDQPARVCDGVDEAVARLAGVPPIDAVAFYLAGVRELFEEAGVLLARDRHGLVRSLDHARWNSYRGALARGDITLADIAQREQVRLALDALTPFSHWITPEGEAKRFDVRFFVAPVPPDQDPSHDEAEMSEGAWLDPSEAIRQCRLDRIALPPPTWTTLRMLERLASVDAAVAWARTTVLVPIQPHIADRDGARTLTLPGDPLHAPLPGFDTPDETRFVLEGRRWRPVT